METGKAGSVSVFEPISLAINKTKQILFNPFSLEKWFVIGFCAWLAGLGGGGGGINFQFNIPSGSHRGAQDFSHLRHELSVILSQVLPWLIPVVITALFVGIAIALLVIWLKSRGQFMFLDCIVRNRGAVSEPWTTYKAEGNSLFGFKFIVWLASSALTVAAIIPLILILISFANREFKMLLVGPLVGAGFLVFGLFVLWLLYSLITVLTDDFVVPIMMLRRCGVMAGWKEFFSLLSANVGRFVLYVLIIVAIGLALGVLTSMIVFAACCCFCCVSWMFFIPIIGGYLFTVLILPLIVWRRSYAVLFLAQFGAAYDLFGLVSTPAPPVSDILEIEPIEPTKPDEPEQSDEPETPANPSES